MFYPKEVNCEITFCASVIRTHTTLVLSVLSVLSFLSIRYWRKKSLGAFSEFGVPLGESIKSMKILNLFEA